MREVGAKLGLLQIFDARRSDSVSYVLVQHDWIHQLLQHSQDLGRYTCVGAYLSIVGCC